MTAEAVGSLSRGSLGEALRDQFDTWRFEKARARQIARIRTEARRIARADSLVDVYEQEISAVHDEVDSFVLPIETAIEDARIKTPEIKAARAGLSTISADALLQDAWSAILRERLDTSNAPRTIEQHDEYGHPTGKLTVIFGGPQTDHASNEQTIQSVITSSWGRLGIGAGISSEPGAQTGFTQLHDGIAGLVDAAHDKINAYAASHGVSPQRIKTWVAEITTAIKADMIAATTAFSLETYLPESVATTLKSLTTLIDHAYTTDSFDAHKGKIQKLWNRFQAEVRQITFERREAAHIQTSDRKTNAGKKIAAELVYGLKSFAEKRALQKALDDQRGIDWFSKLSRFSVRSATGIMILSLILGACNGIKPPGGTATPIPTDTRHDDDNTPTFTTTHNPDITPTTISGPGPYLTGTPEGPQILPFPTDITIVKAVQGLAQNMSLPDWIQSDSGLMADVGNTVDIHQAWCDTPKPCDGTVTAVYSQDFQMYRTLILDDEGHVASWMLIHTDIGDRWAEQGVWDSLLEGMTSAEIQQKISDGDIEFTLPPHTIADSHFEAIWQNGYLVLVEVDHDGNPFQWQDLHGDMHLLVGAELPGPEPVVLFADMSPTGGAAQCADNSFDLDSSNFDTQWAAAMENIRAQRGAPDTDVLLRVAPGMSIGTQKDVAPTASFLFQTLHGTRVPIVGCADANLGEATGRIYFVDSFPFPDGTSISFGLVSEQDAIQQMMSEHIFDTIVADSTAFPKLQQGQKQVGLELYMFMTDVGEDEFRQWAQQRFDSTGSVIVPPIFFELGPRFTELVFQVFYNNVRDPAILAELKTLMDGKLLPGFVTVGQ